ncbi:MAG: cytochrome c [Desulfuromonas sp.]|nr:cytochrome c [Desulfuromonas sp.]
MFRLIFLLFALILAACGERQPNYPARQVPAGLLTDTIQIAAGQVLFREKCATCHGHPDEGRSPRANFFQPPAPDFSSPAYRTVDPAYLFWRIEVGKTVDPYLSRGSVMPAWGPTLNETEIWQLVAYLKVRAG